MNKTRKKTNYKKNSKYNYKIILMTKQIYYEYNNNDNK